MQKKVLLIYSLLLSALFLFGVVRIIIASSNYDYAEEFVKKNQMMEYTYRTDSLKTESAPFMSDKDNLNGRLSLLCDTDETISVEYIFPDLFYPKGRLLIFHSNEISDDTRSAIEKEVKKYLPEQLQDKIKYIDILK